VHPPLIISLHQSGVYGQLIFHLASLHQLNFKVEFYCPLMRDKKEKAAEVSSFFLFHFLYFFNVNPNLSQACK
ncbi:hypothetical protein AB3X48_14455, partial [Bacillus sp. S4]|uniref:hypothetical protein n=1 Tax=Bacillus sp. S4 TaxID=125884 RepID=UPI00349F91DF